jgi:hypothetical protein
MADWRVASWILACAAAAASICSADSCAAGPRSFRLPLRISVASDVPPIDFDASTSIDVICGNARATSSADAPVSMARSRILPKASIAASGLFRDRDVNALSMSISASAC